MKVVEVFFNCGQIDKKFRKVFQFDLNQINKINNENESKISDFFSIGVNSIQFKFKALFRVDINHTYNTSSNELLKSTMVYNNTYNHAYKHIK